LPQAAVSLKNIAMHHLREQRDQFISALTHGFGAFLSVAGGIVLLAMAALQSTAWQLSSAIVFIVSLILLYTASTLYHASKCEQAKRKLKIFDHCAIYVLIAGTYTPFTLIGLREHGGWWLFAIIWALAAMGIIFKLFYTGRFELVSTLIYIGMGWLVVFAIKPLIQQIDSTTLIWLFSGGAAYTFGTIFYMSKKIPYTHSIWHLFVLTGSSCHFVAVSMHVI
jgi:hemolysin III